MQLREIRDYGVDRGRWRNLFKEKKGEEDEFLFRELEASLKAECCAASKIKKVVEEKWLEHGEKIIKWLRDLTKIEFKQPLVVVCVVPFNAGQTPFRDIPLIIVGRIREG
ncbi:MAG: hypothetical protein JSV18_08100 [Candidatus Bathyarchaeota archaeon]|nr:MAG: hypothetical protein JSV18_08100 [Candidatus Bathyarchaeota archaeon]